MTKQEIMKNQAAVETLHQKRTELMIERDAFLSRINSEISGI